MSSRHSPVESSSTSGDAFHFSGESAPFIDVSDRIATHSRINAMSVDVEEYFQVSAFAHRIPQDQWGNYDSRVAASIDRILQLFSDSDAKATFFTLGWIADRHPQMIKQIVAEGHEIACHSYDHTRVREQTPVEFREDVSRTKRLLEDVSGQRVTGYRAPSFSIDQSCPWAHEILQEEGYLYSSSVYPIKHDHYGLETAPRFPFTVGEQGLIEIPPTTILLAGKNFPGAGGGYFRFLPFFYSRWAIDRVNRMENMPAVFYFHPWEIDPDQPRVTQIPVKARFRHYVNLKRFEQRLTRILSEFSWDRFDIVYSDLFDAN